MQPITCDACRQPTPAHDVVNYGSMEGGYRQLCGRCFNEAAASRELLSAREERQYRRELRQRLSAWPIDQPDALVDMLTDMGIYASQVEPYVPLLQEPDALSIMKLAYKLARQRKNSDGTSRETRQPRQSQPDPQ